MSLYLKTNSKNPPPKFGREFYQTPEKEIITISGKYLQKTGGNTSQTSPEASITLIQNQTRTLHETVSITLITIDVKRL